MTFTDQTAAPPPPEPTPTMPYRVEMLPWGLDRVMPYKIYSNGGWGNTLLTDEEAAVLKYVAHLERERDEARAEVARLRAEAEAARGTAPAAPVGQGLRRSNAAKRADAVAILAANPTWSNRRIAEAAGVGDDLIADLRRSQAAPPDSGDPAAQPASEAEVAYAFPPT